MESGESKRYYPQQQELAILNGAIAQYFSYAERSPERSSLANDVSAQLQKFSPHWTKRAVRLWFNNNKNTAPGNQPNQENDSEDKKNQPSGPQYTIRAPSHLSASLQIPPNMQFPVNPMQNMKGLQLQNNNLFPTSPLSINSQIPPMMNSPLPHSPNTPGMINSQQTQMQTSSQPNQQTTKKNSSSTKSTSTNRTATLAGFPPNLTPPQNILNQQKQMQTPPVTSPSNTSAPIHQQTTPPLTQSPQQQSTPPMIPPQSQSQQQQPQQQQLKPSIPQNLLSQSQPLNRPNVHFNPMQMQPNTLAPPSQGQPQLQSSNLYQQSQPPQMQPAKSFNAWPAPDPNRLKNLKQEYQHKLSNILDSLSSNNQQNDEQIKQTASSFESICQQMHSQQMNFAIDDCKAFQTIYFPPSPMSQKDHLSSLLQRPPSFDVNATWQPRKHHTISINTFDTSYNGPDISMYVHSSRTSPKRAITFTKNNQWRTLQLTSSDHVEACVGNNDCAFIMTPYAVTVANLNNSSETPKEVQLSTKIATIASICMGDSKTAIGGLGSSSTIYSINSECNLQTINPESIPPNWGISSLHCLNEKASEGICIAFSHSPVVRVYNPEGKLIRYLLGHTEMINLVKCTDNLILTASEDKTAKIWDSRSSAPFISLSYEKYSIHSCCISKNFALLGTEDRSLCVYDIRGVHPVLGVRTDEYAIESPYYHEEKDKLTMFGVASKDGINDSILFLNDNMESTKYVYRQYAPFVSSLLL